MSKFGGDADRLQVAESGLAATAAIDPERSVGSSGKLPYEAHKADVQHRDRSAPPLLADQKWTGRWVFLLIVKFLWSWNEFFWPMVVISSTQMNVVTMGLTSFTNMYFIEYNLVTAAAAISILPILVIFITLQR